MPCMFVFANYMHLILRFVCITGDGIPLNTFVDFAKGSDVVIKETVGSYTHSQRLLLQDTSAQCRMSDDAQDVMLSFFSKLGNYLF